MINGWIILKMCWTSLNWVRWFSHQKLHLEACIYIYIYVIIHVFRISHHHVWWHQRVVIIFLMKLCAEKGYLPRHFPGPFWLARNSQRHLLANPSPHQSILFWHNMDSMVHQLRRLLDSNGTQTWLENSPTIDYMFNYVHVPIERSIDGWYSIAIFACRTAYPSIFYKQSPF